MEDLEQKKAVTALGEVRISPSKVKEPRNRACPVSYLGGDSAREMEDVQAEI